LVIFASKLGKIMKYKYGENEYEITRYPSSTNKSLIAWNSADELILNYISENEVDASNSIIYNDHFGFLTTFLNEFSPKVVIESKSQEKAILQNINKNEINSNSIELLTPFEKLEFNPKLVIIKIPKSMDLFRYYLEQLAEILDENATVICGFMTKYFTPQILEVANEYFYEIEQTKAVKKSRLLILKNVKSKLKEINVTEIKLNDSEILKQYPGVFSSKNIDYATQFLIENMNLREADSKIMDLASGNGIIAYEMNKKKPNCEIHLVDNSFLAIESSKLNLIGSNFHFHYSDNLDEFEENYFDFIISNPPFHFEHETNIEIAISLFEQSVKLLKNDGHLQVVANKHLNYKTHLTKLFSKVEFTAENEKFIIYEASL
jgi:16S rRNA G1207 methylase RsmC